MGIIAAGQITVVDLSDAPVLNAFITASRPTTQTYSKDSRNYNPSYASTPQVLTLNVTKSGSTTSIIDSISSLHWFVVDGSVKTEIASKDGTSNEYISGNYNEKLTTKINIDTTKGYRRYEATGVWRDPSTDLDVQFSTAINLLLTQNGATGPQGPQGDDGPQGPKGDKGDTGNGIANTVVTYGLSVSDTTEPATWSSSVPTLVKGMYLWTRTVIIYTNGESTTSYQISYIAKDADATAAIDKTKQELLEKLDTVRNDSLAAVEEAKQELTTVANDLSTAKQDLQAQASQLTAQASAQSELTKRVSSVEETANGTKTTVSELTKTVAQNGKDITSVTARTKVVEDDLTSTKTTLSQVQTTADGASSKAATLETGLNGVKADLAATTVTADTTKTNLANYQASNDRAVANLQSNVQTANGDIRSLKTKVEAVPGQITSAVSAVERKIPTSVGGRNYIRNYGLTATGWTFHKAGWNIEIISDSTAKSGQYLKATCITASTSGGGFYKNLFDFSDGRFFGKQMTWSMDIKLSKAKSLKIGPEWGYAYLDTNVTTEWKRYSKTFTVATTTEYNQWIIYTNDNVWNVGDIVYIRDVQLEDGSIATTPVPAIEDTHSKITSLNTTLTQTADGLEQLSTQVTSQGSTIISHTNSINSLATGLSAKVSQSDFNTLSGRVTTAENNITAKANELSSKISSVEGKLPSGEINLVEYGRPADGYSPYAGAEYVTHQFYYNSAYKMYIIRNTATKEKVFGMNRFKVERNTEYTLYFKGFNNDAISHMDVWFLKRVNGSKNGWDSAQQLVSGRKFSASRAEDVSVTFNTGNYDEGYLRFDNNGTTTAGTSADLYFGDVSVKKGKSNNGWSPSLAELASSQDLKNAQSEFKQTTDSIKASVTSLNNSTVKSSSLTINSDGIVMKAGKSTTDVANAIGSYFAVNQNAINLFSDKINVKGHMIVSGSISSDKIAASGITANVIKGGTLQSVNGSTNFELNTGKLFYNNNNTGVFRVQNGASTMGLKFSNTPVTVNGTSRILSRAILGGDRNETTLDDGKWDKGGFSGLVIETIKGAIPAANEHADSLRAISDTIYFTHTYSADSPTGVSAHGWKMETYAPDSSYSGNIVLKPYGINYRQSDIVVGDIRLDNGDGSGYWMRATINTLKACFGHILNGGTSSQALNAIRSELNKISGT